MADDTTTPSTPEQIRRESTGPGAPGDPKSIDASPHVDHSPATDEAPPDTIKHEPKSQPKTKAAAPESIEASSVMHPKADLEHPDFAEFEIGKDKVPWFLWVFFIFIVSWASVSWLPLFGY